MEVILIGILVLLGVVVVTLEGVRLQVKRVATALSTIAATLQETSVEAPEHDWSETMSDDKVFGPAGNCALCYRDPCVCRQQAALVSAPARRIIPIPRAILPENPMEIITNPPTIGASAPASEELTAYLEGLCWRKPSATCLTILDRTKDSTCDTCRAADALAARDRTIQELEPYKSAMDHHLCEHDRADWLGCSLNHNQYCEVCEEHDDGQTNHALKARAESAERRVSELERENSKLQIENRLRVRAVERWVPCSDHRDKTKPSTCYVCKLESSERLLAVTREKLDRAQTFLLILLVMDFGYEDQPSHGWTPIRHQLSWMAAVDGRDDGVVKSKVADCVRRAAEQSAEHDRPDYRTMPELISALAVTREALKKVCEMAGSHTVALPDLHPAGWTAVYETARAALTLVQQTTREPQEHENA